MRVECAFFGPLRDDVGQKTVERTVEEGATVRDLAAALEADYPGLRLLDGGDGFAGEIAVTVDRKDVRHRDGLDTELDDGAVVRITTAVYGG